MTASDNSQTDDVDQQLSTLKSEIEKLEKACQPGNIDSIINKLQQLAEIANKSGLLDAQHIAFSFVAFLETMKNYSLAKGDLLQMLHLLDNLNRTLHGHKSKQVIIKSSSAEQNPIQEKLTMRIVIYVENHGLAGLLLQKITQSGFTAEIISSAQAFQNYIQYQLPAAIIADQASLDKLKSDILPAIVSDASTARVPLIVLAETDDLQARLTAVRAGGMHFFKLPVDIDNLIETLQTLTIVKQNIPYRALFIDDDRIMSMLYSMAMQKIGIETRTINDPFMALETIEEFNPDIIITDLYMPGCNGLELATVLRQNQVLADTPILFISSDIDIQLKMEALQIGADDFLRKPIDEATLQVAILARARRARALHQTRKENQRIYEHLKRIEQAIDKHNIVSIADIAGNIVYVNQKFCEISGYGADELLGFNHRIVKSDVHPPEFYKQLWQTISQGYTWRGEICNRRKDGSYYWVDATITPELNKYGLIDRYISVRTDITATKNMQEQLKISRDEAETANQSKSVFLGKISHEFKTPLNSIIGFSQLMQSDPDTPITEDQQDMLSCIEQGGYHLLNLINDLVDLARIDTGYLTLNRESIVIGILIKECLNLLQPQIQQKDIRLQVEDIDSGQTVFADRMRLKQVLINLISNAIKYNRDQGLLKIVCQSQQDTCLCSVFDTGIGIAKEDLSKIFQPFSRLEKSAQNIEGTGIGLALSKNLIERMDGEMGVISEIDLGSEFWFTLPRNKPSNVH